MFSLPSATPAIVFLVRATLFIGSLLAAPPESLGLSFPAVPRTPINDASVAARWSPGFEFSDLMDVIVAVAEGFLLKESSTVATGNAVMELGSSSLRPPAVAVLGALEESFFDRGTLGWERRFDGDGGASVQTGALVGEE